MTSKTTLFLCTWAASAVMLTGCTSTGKSSSSSDDTTKKVAKTAAKVAVKSAIRNSPVSIVKAVK